MQLFTAQTSDANGTSVKIGSFGARRYDIFTMYVWGTFGSGTVKLQISADETEWFDVPDATFTAKGVLNIQFRAPHARAVLSGSSGASINAMLR